MGRKAIDLEGKRFGMLVVLRRAGHEENCGKHVQWLCACDCGAQHIARGTNLTAKKVTRCKACSHNKVDPERIGHETVVDIWYYAAGERGGFAVARSELGRVLAVTPWSQMPQRLVGDAAGHTLARRCLRKLAEAGVIRAELPKEGARQWAHSTRVKVRAHLFTPMDRMDAEWAAAQQTYGEPPPA